MSIPKISQVIKELQKVQESEGDILISCEGFFGECGGVKYHVREVAKNKRFWSPYTHAEEDKGEKILQLSHL